MDAESPASNGQACASFEADAVQRAVAKVTAWMQILKEPGELTELRILGASNPQYRKPHIEAGWFDYGHIQTMAYRALRFQRDGSRASGIYWTLNPINPALLARRANKIDAADNNQLTADKDILQRRWLPIDVDPTRPSGISSTDAEKAQAAAILADLRAFLAERGWPEPVIQDSGNGWHALYRVDLPVADDGLVQRCLQALAARFTTEAAKVDTSVHNPARIWKFPGTLAAKGDSIPDRPHRRAKIIEFPEPVSVVAVELLEALAAEAPAATKTTSGYTGSQNGQSQANENGSLRLRVADWLTARGVEFRIKDGSTPDGRTIYLLSQCPFDISHGTSSGASEVCIMQWPNGALGAKCMHNSCEGRGWQEFKASIGAPTRDFFDPPRKRKKRPQPVAGPIIGPAEEDDDDGDLLLGYQIILDHFREGYDPIYRRGNVIYSRTLGREVKPGEACFAPGLTLAKKLELASDAPRTEQGPAWSKVPQFFRQWAGSAWQDMLRGLPDEDQADQIDELSREVFRGSMGAALHTMVSLGEVHDTGDGEERTQIQRRTVLDWCLRFAKEGAWGDVRGHQVWATLRKTTEDNQPKAARLRIALRVELFSQLARTDLAKLTATKFTQLCKLYGVGFQTRVNGRRAVELCPDWLAEHLERPEPPDPEPPFDDTLTEVSRTRIREENKCQSVNSDATVEGIHG